MIDSISSCTMSVPVLVTCQDAVHATILAFIDLRIYMDNIYFKIKYIPSCSKHAG